MQVATVPRNSSMDMDTAKNRVWNQIGRMMEDWQVGMLWYDVIAIMKGQTGCVSMTHKILIL